MTSVGAPALRVDLLAVDEELALALDLTVGDGDAVGGADLLDDRLRQRRDLAPPSCRRSVWRSTTASIFSLPVWKMSSNAELIWPVRMNVPATIATPRMIAIDVRMVRSLRASRPRTISRSTPTPAT